MLTKDLLAQAIPGGVLGGVGGFGGGGGGGGGGWGGGGGGKGGFHIWFGVLFVAVGGVYFLGGRLGAGLCLVFPNFLRF